MLPKDVEEYFLRKKLEVFILKSDCFMLENYICLKKSVLRQVFLTAKKWVTLICLVANPFSLDH